VIEPLIDPEVDQDWTSDRELDRLAPLAESLHYWAGVYDRWRSHELAMVRPEQAPFDHADLTAIDDLRGVHIGQLAAASQRLRHGGAAAARLAESLGPARSGLAGAWPGGAAQWWETLQRDIQDCAAQCTALGSALQIAVIDTVAAVLTSAVDEILVRSGRLPPATGSSSREIFEQRIAELPVSGDAGALPEVHRIWCTQLDTLSTDYDAVIGLLRATLAAAGSTVTRTYQALSLDLGSSGHASSGSVSFGDVTFEGAPSGESGPATPPSQVAGLDSRPAGVFTGTGTTGTDQTSGLAPASTVLASVALVGDTGPSSGSSPASGGGSSDRAPTPVAPAPGSAVLGELNEPQSPGPGGAVLGSVSGEEAQDGAGAGSGASAVAGGGPGHRDREREASWARLRALLGEQAGEYPDRPR